MRIVVALGGNALLPPGKEIEYERQEENIRETAQLMAKLSHNGNEMVVTHGNGPQAGNILVQQQAAPPRMPLDVVVAETQGQIGYMLQRELGKHLDSVPATVLTQVEVEKDDPAFENPSKPVGPFYTREETRKKEGVFKKTGSGRQAFRRVVPSPKPRSVVELGVIRTLLSEKDVVIAAGGGGIPITKDNEGVEAVVDKDRTSSLLAQEIDADMLIILTDVEYVQRNYGTDEAEPIKQMNADEARDMIEAEEFEEGSMQPKVEAAVEFVEETGMHAVITSLEQAENAVDGHGTVIRR